MIELVEASVRWPRVPLAELCDLRGGYPAPQNEDAFVHGGIPFVRMKDVGRDHFTRCLDRTDDSFSHEHLAAGRYELTPRGSILMPRSGSVALNHRALLGVDAVIVSHLCAAVPKSSRVSSEYLYRVLCLADMRKLTKRTTGLDSIALSDLSRIAIPLPSLHEQRRIAEILDQADVLRAKRRAALAQVDGLTQAIFLEMFGDPVTNPMRWPDPKIEGALLSLQYGPRFYNENYSERGVRVVRITDLAPSGELDFQSMPRLEVSEFDRRKYELREGDLLFARTGATVGKVALIRDSDPSCIAGAYFITLRFKDRVRPEYARQVLASGSVQEIVAKRSRQAAQQNFSGPSLRELPMPLPPLGLQSSFASRAAAVDKLKTAHRASLAQLDALFASLQHRAFRGEL